MRNLPFGILLVLFLFNLSACEEVPPEINPIGGGGVDTSSISNRKVLIEEFTGVRCVNCPAGSAVIQDLKDQYGERLVVVAVHAGFFSPPYPESQVDFRTPESDAILNLLGQPLGYPSAVVNRKLIEGEDDLQLGSSLWPGFIAQELERPAPVEISLAHTFDPSDRSLELEVEIQAIEELPPDEILLSVILTETDISDVQLTPNGKQADYVHKYNLRDMLTAPTGSLITAELNNSGLALRNYFASVPNTWIAENITLVVLVHRAGDSREVLQVETAGLIN